MNAAGNTDPAGLRGRLQPRGDVDAITQQVLAMHHDITEVDPNSESHLAGGRQLIVARSKCGLNVGGAPHRFHRAIELRQDRIPGRIENASAMHGHQRLEYLSVTSKYPERLLFILAHQAAELGHIRRKNCR